MRVVLDSNVFISGLMLPQSIPGKIISAWHGRQFDLVLSDPMLIVVAAYCPIQKSAAAPGAG